MRIVTKAVIKTLACATLLLPTFALAATALDKPMGMAPAIIGSTWTAIEIDGTAPPTARSTFKITEEMKAVGNGGCNSYFAPVVLEGDTIRLGGIASTRKACHGTMQQEAAYFAALGAARTWQAEDGQLRFIDATGKIVIRFAIA